jgi:hypothetical protein
MSTTYYWQATNSTDLGNGANFTPARTSPQATDAIVADGVNFPPDQTTLTGILAPAASLSLTGAVTLAGSGCTLNCPQIAIAAGSSLRGSGSLSIPCALNVAMAGAFYGTWGTIGAIIPAPAVGPAAAVALTYCDSTTDLNNIFGQANLDKWANLSLLDPSTAAGQQAIANQRIMAVEFATAYIEDRLRDGPYAIPVLNADGTVPRTVVRICATAAGVWLYENLGAVHMNEETGEPEHRYAAYAKWVDRMLDMIRAGKLRLTAGRSGSGRGCNSPFVSRSTNPQTWRGEYPAGVDPGGFEAGAGGGFLLP